MIAGLAVALLALAAAARRCLRTGVVLLGRQLALADVVRLGWPTVVVVLRRRGTRCLGADRGRIGHRRVRLRPVAAAR